MDKIGHQPQAHINMNVHVCVCVCDFVPDVKCGVEDVGLFQAIQLNLAVAHLVVHTLQLVVQLQLLPFEFAVFFLIPSSANQ